MLWPCAVFLQAGCCLCVCCGALLVLRQCLCVSSWVQPAGERSVFSPCEEVSVGFQMSTCPSRGFEGVPLSVVGLWCGLRVPVCLCVCDGAVALEATAGQLHTVALQPLSSLSLSFIASLPLTIGSSLSASLSLYPSVCLSLALHLCPLSSTPLPHPDRKSVG